MCGKYRTHRTLEKTCKTVLGASRLCNGTHVPMGCPTLSPMFQEDSKRPYYSPILISQEVLKLSKLSTERKIDQTETRGGPHLILDVPLPLSFLSWASKNFPSLSLVPFGFEDKIRKRDKVGLKLKEAGRKKEVESKKNSTHVWDIHHSPMAPSLMYGRVLLQEESQAKFFSG